MQSLPEVPVGFQSLRPSLPSSIQTCVRNNRAADASPSSMFNKFSVLLKGLTNTQLDAFELAGTPLSTGSNW